MNKLDKTEQINNLLLDITEFKTTNARNHLETNLVRTILRALKNEFVCDDCVASGYPYILLYLRTFYTRIPKAELLDIFNTHFTPDEFDDLIYFILTKNSQHNFGGVE